MIPGPTNVPHRVLRALSKPMVGHRSDDFHRCFDTCTARLKQVFRTNNDLFIFASSGTGAMEAALANTLSPGDSVLCLVNGVFGDRFSKIAKAYGADVTSLEFPTGVGADPDSLRKALKQKSFKAVTILHNETSTGVLNDLAALAPVVKETDALLIVDTISGVLSAPLEADQWGIDLLVGGSQKAFMLPPGLAFLAVSEKAWKAVETCKSPSFYFNLPAMRTAAEKSETAYTPAIGLFFGLDEALNVIFEEGIEASIARHGRLRDAVRAGLRALNLQLLAQDWCASRSVTAIHAPEGLDEAKMRKWIREQYAILMTGGQGALRGKIFRIGHLGYVFDPDVIATMGALEQGLANFGYPVETGKAVSAAQKVLAQSQ